MIVGLKMFNLLLIMLLFDYCFFGLLIIKVLGLEFVYKGLRIVLIIIFIFFWMIILMVFVVFL